MTQRRKQIAVVFMLLAVVLATIFYFRVEFPQDLAGLFKKDYYGQFGPIAIAIELLVAGYYLFTRHEKANFTLALFGFTAVLDPFFNLVGLFPSQVPVYATVLFVICAVFSLWLAFTNTFKLGRISFWSALWSFLVGNAIELFFNYL